MGGKSSKKLNKEDLDFLLNNTSFTKPQIKQWYKGFMVSYTLYHRETADSEPVMSSSVSGIF